MQRLLPPSLRRSFTGLEVGLSVLSLSLVVLLAECYWSDPRAAGAQQAAIAGQAGAPTTTVAPGSPQEVDRLQRDERTSPDATRGEPTDPPPTTSPPSTTPPGTEPQPGTSPPGTSPPRTTITPRTAPPGTSPTPTTRPVPLTSSPRTSRGGASQESGTKPPPRSTPPPTKSVPPASPPDNGTTKDTSRERDSVSTNEAMTTIYFAGPAAPPDAYEFFLGTVELGAKGVAERIAVTNLTSETPVEVDMVTLEGSDPGDFEIIQDKCTGTTVPRDGYCVVKVVFAPSNACYRTATLVISGPSDTATAGLNGTGVDPANPSGCELAGDSQPSETSATTTPPSVTATATTVPPSTD
jgi:hypothetical protein